VAIIAATVLPSNSPALSAFVSQSNRKALVYCQHRKRGYDVDTMHISTSSRRKSFGLLAVFGTLGVVLLGAMALLAGVSPARAANFASQPDTQIAVFMIPLTLLVLVLLFEAARFVWRGTPPTQGPARSPRPTDWALSEDAP
jgi:hypothetical protein